MEFIKEYQLLFSAVIGWASAQIIKTIVHAVTMKEICPERLFGTGGMPSSHSATTAALWMSSLLIYGPSSFEATVTLILMIIVQVDAMGVRQETGKQAKLLNKLLELNAELKTMSPEQVFKELVGHTPLQVLVGTVLGMLVSIVIDAVLNH